MRVEACSPEELGRYEHRVINTASRYNAPLLKAAWNRWAHQDFADGGKRGWFLCSPTASGMSRILNSETGVPVRRTGKPLLEEYLQLPDLLYDPRVFGGNAEDIMDHVAILYHNGRGQTIFIDPVYRFLWGDKKGLTGEVPEGELHEGLLMEKIPTKDIGKVLREKYGLFPFLTYEQGVGYDFYLNARRRFGLTASPQELTVDLYKWNDLLHTDGITSPLTVKDPTERHGPPLAGLIRDVLKDPDWKGLK
jgi:hypothetical protein